MNIENLEVWREIVSKVAPPEDHERLLSQGEIIRQVGDLDWAIDRCGEYPGAPLLDMLRDHMVVNDIEPSPDIVYVLLRSIARAADVGEDSKRLTLQWSLLFSESDSTRLAALNALADVGTEWARDLVQLVVDHISSGYLRYRAAELLEHWGAK